MSDLILDPSVLPLDGRFGCGPAKVRPEQVKRLRSAGAKLLGTSHRQAPVKALVGSVRERIATLFQVPDGYEVLLANGGSTSFWDAAAFGLIEQRSQHLSFGEFGAKFASVAAAPWLTAPHVDEAPAGSVATLTGGIEADVVAWPQNETSTGAMAPVQRPGSDALVVVDATSGAGGLPIDIAQTDLYYFAPQKNFGSDGGLWFAIASPAAIERIARIDASDRYIPETLRLSHAVSNSRLNQTLNTPAIATLVMLDAQLEWMLTEGGLGWAANRTKTSSDLLYRWAESRPETSPFVSDPAHRSRVVVTIDVDESIDATVISRTLRANGIVDTEPYRKLGRNQLRIATFVGIDPDDVRQLTRALDEILDSGVAAREGAAA